MGAERVVVGYDGSLASLRALTWTVRRARVTDVVLVLTAWTPGPARPDVTARRQRIVERQRAAIGAALAVVRPASRPVVSAVVAMADPVTALADAADLADRVVIGGHGRGPLATALARRLVERPRPYGGPCPLSVVGAGPLIRAPRQAPVAVPAVA